MIKFSEATAIALHAVFFIAKEKGRLIPLTEISKTFDVSGNHLSKVLQRLVKCGILSSVKGPLGGFKMAKKGKLTYLDIYKCIEGDSLPTHCLFAKKKFACKNCIMGGVLHKMQKDFFSHMSKTRIQ